MKKVFLLMCSFALLCVHAFAAEAKYVFLFIGDGMAAPQVSSAEVYAGAISQKNIEVERLAFTQFPVAGMMTTYDAGSFITDSASAGTAMASGHKTLSGVINMDPGKTKKFTPITYDLKDAGYKIGIVSSVSLDHATPASFYSAVPSRGNMYDIALQVADSGFDYYSGGGFAQRTGKDKNQTDVYSVFKNKGYTVATTTAEIRALKPGTKAVAVNGTLQDSFAMPYEIDRKQGDLSLADHTKKAIEMLENPNGFFLMVEGGKIDWACHANDAASSITDVIALDSAVKVALDFYKKHPKDTLIIVTGDHETGGMSIGFAGTQYATFFDKVSQQKGSYIRFDAEILAPYKAKMNGKPGALADLNTTIKDYFGFAVTELSPDEQDAVEVAFKRSMGGELENTSNEMLYLLFGGYEPLTVKLTQIMNQRAGIGWTTYAHTGVPVPVFAIGAGAADFGGYYDNTAIYSKLAKLSGVKSRVAVAK